MIHKQQEHLYVEELAIVKNYRPIEELVPANWSEGDVLANGIRLHYYRTGGDKPMLLLLHGINEYGLTWLRVAKALAGDYDIIMVDARGHGRSDGIAKAGYPPGANVEDIAGVIRALELGRPRIIGLSMGGSTALNLAAKYSMKLWDSEYQGDPAALLKQVTCPALIMKHAWAFPAPGTQPTVRALPAEQTNISIVYFEHTGHLIRRVAFAQYMTLAQEFLSAH